MARRKRAEKREILPDPVFKSTLAAKFINNIMGAGKKGVAEQIFYTAIDKIEEQTGDSGIEVFEKAIDNASPILEVKSRRIGGATYQVPIEVDRARKKALAMRWILSSCRNTIGNRMPENLAEELIAASRGEGGAVRKKEDVHRMAEANKAFAHFR
ncbi:MAG TPA: 30S ribosomal protein S7 [bacterium]|nr:30S ribosomal protein S7 [bacterium]